MSDDNWQREWNEASRELHAASDRITASIDASIATCDRIIELIEQMRCEISDEQHSPPSMGFV